MLPETRPQSTLEWAFSHGTNRELMDALVEQGRETLMVRGGEVLTAELAEERMRNFVAAWFDLIVR